MKGVVSYPCLKFLYLAVIVKFGGKNGHVAKGKQRVILVPLILSILIPYLTRNNA